MVREISKKIIFFITAIFLINFISASYLPGSPNHTIGKYYGAGEPLFGWINISLNNEPVNSVIKSKVGNMEKTISLIDFLNKDMNLGFNYTCNPLDCSSDYKTSDSGEASKTLNLNDNGSAIIGFKLTAAKPVTDVSGFSFKVASNNPESSKLPLSVDVLNDNQIEWSANKGSGKFGQKNQGCYISDSSVKQTGITTLPYCEKINLTTSPSVKIGANVLGSAPSIPFTLSITDINRTTAKNCAASASADGEISCTPAAFSPGDGEYFICINAKNSADNNKYKINYEQNSPCGFSGSYTGSYDYDFDIFSQTETFAANSATTISNTAIQNELKSYLSARYNNNCSGGCIIPIKINSGVLQQVSITEPSLSYFAGISIVETTLYNLEETPNKLSADFQRIYLDNAKFPTPNEIGNYTAAISFNDNPLFSEKIIVENGPQIKYLFPISTAVNYSTKFKVYLNSSVNATKYFWNFGDGKNASTTTDEIEHTYSTEGNYNLEVTVYSKEVSASKTFTVVILPLSAIVPTLIQNFRTDIDNINNQVRTSNFSDFEKRSLNYSLKLDDTKALLDGMYNNLSLSTSNSDYQTMFNQLITLKIPKKIARTISGGNILFYPLPENIDLNAVATIGGGNYSSGNEGDYKNAVLAWEEGNVDTNLIYNEFAGIFDGHEESVLKTFEVTTTKKDSTANPFLIIKNMDNLFFNQDYSQKAGEGYVYLTLDQPENKIIFSTTGNVDFTTLPMFVSPKISDLSLDINATPLQRSNKWIWFAIIALLIIITGLAIYLLIRLWYKRKYENYLFKNRNNLYNLENYIDGEKKKGVGEREIISRLKKSGWNSEQISYAMKKYLGKKIV